MNCKVLLNASLFVFLMFNTSAIAQKITTEKVVADVLEEEKFKGSYKAYYNDVPMGTVLQIQLAESQVPKVVFVEVIGQLPEKTKKKTTLLLSPYAYQKLGEPPTPMKVTVIYTP